MSVRYAIITSLALLAAPALAHIAEPRPGESITVIAPRLDAEKTAEAARTYADRVLQKPPLYGQFARWRAPVCIKVSGVDPIYAPRIEGRIRTVAKVADIPVAEAGCKPNLLVVFTPDARKTVEVIVTRKPRTLRRLAAEERRAVEEGALPVRWWYVIEQTDHNGIPASPMSTAVASAPAAMGGKSLIDLIPMNSDTVMTDNYMGGSVIDTNLIASVTGAVAVVDVPLATGVSLDALSEYLALVTLAPTRLPPTSPGVPSILDLFRPDVAIAPETLSRWDAAFLTGLYQSADSRRASWQRGQIVEHLKTAMEP